PGGGEAAQSGIAGPVGLLQRRLRVGPGKARPAGKMRVSRLQVQAAGGEVATALFMRERSALQRIELEAEQVRIGDHRDSLLGEAGIAGRTAATTSRDVRLRLEYNRYSSCVSLVYLL